MIYTDSYKMTNQNDRTPVRQNRQMQYGYPWTQRLLKTQKPRNNLLSSQNDQQNLGYQSARHQTNNFDTNQDITCSITQFTLDQSLDQSQKQPVHKRSMTQSSSKNKFYCFSKIKEDKCRQQQLQSTRVIKSIKKVNNQKNNLKESKSLNPRKRIIEHLDQVLTVESKHSPRSSLNSLFSPEVQQSLIIMRGCDFINSNEKTDNNRLSKFFQSRRKSCNESIIINENDDTFGGLFKGKGLIESRDWGNRHHRGSVRQKSSFFHEDQSKIMNSNQKIIEEKSKESKIQSNNDKKMEMDKMHYFLKHAMAKTDNALCNENNNSLSFLRVKKPYANSPRVNIK